MFYMIWKEHNTISVGRSDPRLMCGYSCSEYCRLAFPRVTVLGGGGGRLYGKLILLVPMKIKDDKKLNKHARRGNETEDCRAQVSLQCDSNYNF